MSDKAPNSKVETPKVQDTYLAELSTLAEEYNQDRKILRYAFIAAAAFHVVLFMITFPSMSGKLEAGQKKQRKIFVVQQPNFKPPEVQKKVETLKPRTVKVPIPDPTPDEPEPVRNLDTQEEAPQVVPDEQIFGVPDAPPEPEPEGPIRVGGQIKEPKTLRKIPPTYPEIARKARIEGVVILEATIDKQGNVENVKVLRGLPMGLTEAAVEAVKQWKYEPSTLNGKPVEVLMTVTVTFRLQ